MNDIIVKTVARIIVPFIQMYGIFVILNGHISPGGGFAGGALIGVSLILYTLVFGVGAAEKKFSHRLGDLSESGGILIYLLIGSVGIVSGGYFLTNLEAGFLKGETGALLSGGMIPLLMVAIGIKVTSTIITLFHAMIEEDPS